VASRPRLKLVHRMMQLHGGVHCRAHFESICQASN
jgi:hypothetical protein